MQLSIRQWPGLKTAAARDGAAEWLPVLFGLLVLYLPTLYDLMHGAWVQEEQAHGPIFLGLSLWLIYRRWPQMIAASAGAPSARIGWPLLVFGLLCYVLGRSQKILPLEIGSMICLFAAVILIKRGYAGFRVLWFAFFFMLFMIPLPGPLVTALTLPMKKAVSYVTEGILYLFGYPIARTGVILQIGPYQLLVADACAGLQTLLTLEALGMLYMNMVRHTSAFRNTVLAVLIVPISFVANVIRVIILTLVTFYFGDAVGQGFLHGFAGMVLFISALVLILSIDTLLQFIVSRWQHGRVKAPAP